MSSKSRRSARGLAAGIGLIAATSFPALAETITFTGSAGRISSTGVSGTDYTILAPPAANPLFFSGKMADVTGPNGTFNVSDTYSFVLSNPLSSMLNGLNYTASFGPGGTLSVIGGVSGVPGGGSAVLETANIAQGTFQVACNDNGCSNGLGTVVADLTNVNVNPSLLTVLGLSGIGPLEGEVTLSNMKVGLNGTVSACFPTPSPTCSFHSTSMDSQITNFPAAEPPGEIPLPAALPLFASGLGALGMLGWRRKRKAAAAS
jgi:hypothetical protein